MFLLVLGLAAPAAASDGPWPVAYSSVAHNPADALAELPIEDSEYDPATHCSKKPKPGMTALVDWLGARRRRLLGHVPVREVGPEVASLHAEGRAVDWQLDVDVPADRREAERLIALFLAPDRLGQPQALARRMGVEEIIWDCGYWGAGMEQFRAVLACLSKRGKLDARQQDGRPPRPPAHRADQGRRGQEDLLLDALRRSWAPGRSVAATTARCWTAGPA